MVQKVYFPGLFPFISKYFVKITLAKIRKKMSKNVEIRDKNKIFPLHQGILGCFMPDRRIELCKFIIIRGQTEISVSINISFNILNLGKNLKSLRIFFIMVAVFIW